MGVGLVTLYLSLIVLIPLAAVVWKSTDGGLSGFWRSVTNPEAWAALRLTVIASLLVALINVVFGTLSRGCWCATTSPASGWWTA